MYKHPNKLILQNSRSRFFYQSTTEPSSGS